jgi:hypothetical protein
MNHTKGPWRLKRSTTFRGNDLVEYYWVGTGAIGDESPVCSLQVKVKYNEEQLANARLIAAAPEMLEALRMCEAMLHAQGLKAEIDREPFTRELELIAVKQAIAKAEGK